MILAGLTAQGSTPRQRRAALSALGDAELAAQVLDLLMRHASVADGELAALSEFIDAPLPEVAASPFGARAVALAANAGAALVQHELRAVIAWHEELGDDDAVRDENHGVWDRGVLGIGKYQSFLQDDPLSSFNPSHMAKWTPHELLHRVGGCCWRPGMPAWELYLGARLNEIVPVVLWYGLDEIARRDSVGFVRAEWTRSPAVRPEEVAWRKDPATWPGIAERAVALVRRTLAHFEREIAAVQAELSTGRRHFASADGLDSASDATAYVVGHSARLADRAVARCLERVVAEPGDRSPYVDEYLERIEQLFDALLFGDLALEWDVARCRRDARLLRDWFQRAAHLGWAEFRPCVPLLADAAAAIAGAEVGSVPDLADWHRRLSAAIHSSDAASVVFETGARWPTGMPTLALRQLTDGIDSLAPLARREADAAETGWIERFARSGHLAARAPLGTRLLGFFAATPALDEARAMLELELAIARADARSDDAVERLSASADELPGRLDLAQVWASEAFVMETIEAAAFERHAQAETPFDPPPTGLLIGGYNGGVSIVPVWPPLASVWQSLGDSACTAAELVARLEAALSDAGEGAVPDEMPQTGEEWLAEWVEAGAVGWVLVPDRRSRSTTRPIPAASAAKRRAATA